MKKAMLWSALGSIALGSIAFGEGFEAPTYHDGQSIDRIDGWSVLGTATVTAEQSAEGSQSLKISSSGTVSKSLVVPGIRFIDLAVLPSYSDAEQPAENLNIGGAKLGFVRSGSGGQITLISGTGTGGNPVGTPYTIEADHLGKDWVRITIREDTKKGIWDLFLDGKPIVFDQALAKDTLLFQIDNASGEAIYLDSYSESSDNPLFQDSDQDGMPDAYEIGNGLNPTVNDRDGDLDGDGISNIQEMFSRTSPRVAANAPSPGSILYVDNRNGSDSNAGTSSYFVNGDGPKASIKGAIIAGKNGDTIVILRGTGTYAESSIGVEGKSLTIKPMENITIK